MSEDPILSDANSYRYVENMTTTFVDQNGLEGQWFDNDWTDRWNPFAFFGRRGHELGTRLGDAYSAWFIDDFSTEVYRRRQQLIFEELSDPGSSTSPSDVACERLSILSDGLGEFGDLARRAADLPVAALELGADVGLTVSAAGPIFARPTTVVVKTGGRLGNEATRRHVARVASELERRGFEITGGGGRFPEEFIAGPGGGRAGCAYPDITAIKNGRTIRINTVDTLTDGITLTKREARNAAKIRGLRPNDHLVTIPKPK